MMDMTGRVAVVTGGASGIGAACCAMLADLGARVAVVDVNLAGAETVAAGLSGEGHAAAFLDVRDEAAVEALAAKLDAEMGPASALVTSAGVLQLPQPPEDLPMSEWDRVVAVDQRGVWVSCVAWGRRMALRGTGSIVNIASVAGMRALPLHAYSPAKAAVISMTECLATEWGRSGVRVNAVSPGFTLTPALAERFENGERDPKPMQDMTPMGRLVRPKEIASAVCFLCSEASSAISGITVPVDGGWLSGPAWTTYAPFPAARGNA
ncbi:SDR family NAD(P)-dependent oxidoreductase [Albimonas pacifica]|uniref:NAD(P)-dependent dehydrogenase, short-chain alcohol dehydrogenase family n=1 Tax=Albimonas pacifica TaxID=1114924 RepID=A0A1I3L059_9RHOB|nr:SDR family oxidoreductase [Albimonas pacifica]SFI77968.1 NAD(P)-dependent dehydrogenase, short-chain alcohol dehydrogenase family [Albimonas pacifica]